MLLWLSTFHYSVCQTRFPATSDDVIVLSRDNSPYVSAQDVVIRAGQRLLVDHGVTVKFAPGTGLDVHGQLLVKGREDDRVVFTLWENYKETRSNGHKYRRHQEPRIKLTNGDRDDTGNSVAYHWSVQNEKKADL